jgi:hypothetical protein
MLSYMINLVNDQSLMIDQISNDYNLITDVREDGLRLIISETDSS